MGLRITTWNVNGIRNPFGYQPWRDKRTFEAMFDILEADIVVMQETKIQRKDLRDDMVLVPGWDVYFSLPKHKKGYSGVAIYTRNAICAPIRAEEGITGVLCPPNSSISFCDLPEDQQVGGYPSLTQLANFPLDMATLDSEGRCVILEFPAFILIGVYNPANRDESRDEFRLGFLNALDARVRNLVAAGKRVFLTGDLNIIREEIDTANADEQLRKHSMTGEEYMSTPARRLFNQLLVGGKVIGERDEDRQEAVLWDICRGFHPGRKGMFTCWETKINARPGNFGSRIDYVLCSADCKDWFCDSNIQEGLIGSDHCPVYAVIRDTVEIDGSMMHIKDIMNPLGMFKNGVRQREWNSKDLLPTSAKLIPEFDRRRNIRDMFSKKPAIPVAESSKTAWEDNDGKSINESQVSETVTALSLTADDVATDDVAISSTLSSTATIAPGLPAIDVAVINAVVVSPKANGKRHSDYSSSPVLKRSKSGGSNSTSATGKGQPAKGQSSLKGFFKPKNSSASAPLPRASSTEGDSQGSSTATLPAAASTITTSVSTPTTNSRATTPAPNSPTQTRQIVPSPSSTSSPPPKPFRPEDQESVIDPIAAKESWSKLLSKRIVPRCEHQEPCISYVTKKPGVNCGRSFYMCARPLGPSGQKQRGDSQWKCGTFIWSSDWNSGSSNVEGV